MDTHGMSLRLVAVELRGLGQATQAQEFLGMLDEAEVTWGGRSYSEGFVEVP